MITTKQDDLLTTAQTARMLGVPKSTVKYWRHSKPSDPRSQRLPFVKLGRRCIRYRKADVEAFINRQTVSDKEEEG